MSQVACTVVLPKAWRHGCRMPVLLRRAYDVVNKAGAFNPTRRYKITIRHDGFGWYSARITSRLPVEGVTETVDQTLMGRK